MIRPRDLLFAGAYVLACVGLVSVVVASRIRAGADADLMQTTMRTLPRALEASEIERLAHLGTAGRSEALRLVREEKTGATGPVLASLEVAERCLGSEAPGCDVGAALEDARSAYRSALTEASGRVALRRSTALRSERIGAILFAVGIGLAGILAVRRQRIAAEEAAARERDAWACERAQSETDRASLRGAETLLRSRLEELYTTRRRVWETDRFAAYGEIAAGLSHGLKTPLAGIRAATQAAQLKLGPDHPVSRNLDDVVSEVDALVEQIRRFLQASGSGEPVPARVLPDSILPGLAEDYRETARNRRVAIAVRCESPGEILVDPALLEIALRNLLENALSIAPPGSTVELLTVPTVAPERVGLDDRPAFAGDTWLEITVKDEGPGMRSALRTGASSRPDGSGLGVAIARRVAARHGGALRFDSTPGQGTAARLLFPLARKAEAA